MVDQNATPDFDSEIYIDPSEAQKLKLLLAERRRRQHESLRLYSSLPNQEAFHASRARQRIVWGSNRSGKTLCTSVEIGRAITGCDPYKKWPKSGRFWVVAKNLKEVGEVLYPKLFQAGAFKMIRDEITQEWRAWLPWQAYDQAYAEKTKPAPPIVPPRHIQAIAWYEKKKRQAEKVLLHNGWEVTFFSADAMPTRGADIDGCLFDEEIGNPAWYSEIQARLVDRRGRFIWGATPQSGTEELFNLYQMALEQSDYVRPTVTQHNLLIRNNPYISEQQLQEFAEPLSDLEYKVRIEGEFVTMAHKVYTEWSRLIHCCEAYQIPSHWTRYVAFDPGRQMAAALFLACPPKEESDQFVFYDELYLANCNAVMLGEEMAKKSAGQDFYAFVIDDQEGRKYETGSGIRVKDQYTREFVRLGVKSTATGSAFISGSPNRVAGEEELRNWLLIRPKEKTPLIVVFPTRCPNFVKEIERFRYKVEPKTGLPTNDSQQRGKVHLMACARYLAMLRPHYIEKEQVARKHSPAYAAWLRMKAERDKDKKDFINLGPD